MRPGTSSQATIIVEHLPKVLALPLECVFDREGKKVAYVRRGEGFRMVEVKLGAETKIVWSSPRGSRRGIRWRCTT